jgi:hypothetical protein
LARTWLASIRLTKVRPGSISGVVLPASSATQTRSLTPDRRERPGVGRPVVDQPLSRATVIAASGRASSRRYIARVRRPRCWRHFDGRSPARRRQEDDGRNEGQRRPAGWIGQVAVATTVCSRSRTAGAGKLSGDQCWAEGVGG